MAAHVPLPRRWRLWAGVVAAVVLLAAAYMTWRILQVRHDLLDARHQAAELRAAVAAGDDTRAERALAAFTARTDAARRHTSALWWRAADHAPIVGDDARTIRLSAIVGSELGHQLQPLVRDVGANLPQRLAPHDGRIDLAAVSRLRVPVASAEGSLNQAVQQLDAVDQGSLFGFVRRPFASLLGQLRDARDGLTSARRAVQVLPSMLGQDGPRRYLVMFDNNAEIRANGGMPGAWAILDVDHGKISLGAQGGPYDVGVQPRPILPLTRAEKALYNDQLGEYMHDTNFTPDYPRTATLAAAMWQKHFGKHLDGVMSTDTVTLAYLLQVTGPIHAPGGVELTPKNAVDELLHNVYKRLHTNPQQDAFYRAVARQVFDKLTKSASPSPLVRALARSVTEGRTYLHSFHAAEQQVLASSRIAGALDFSAGSRPQLGIYLNDATGAKMSYYLSMDVQQHSTSCSAGRQSLDSSFTLHMRRPEGPLNVFITGPGIYGTPKGQQTVLARIYGPVGGRLTGFRIDGESFPPYIRTDRGRPVSLVAVRLTAGKSVRVTWQTTSGPGQTGPTVLSTTPTITSGRNVTTVPSAS
jgi:hypothetical protein